ncbi:phage tail protein [Delftia acidovorans]
MLKLQSLRDFLAQCAPDLARDPENFIVYGDDGRLIATGTASLSFEYRYTAYATLLGYAGHPGRHHGAAAGLVPGQPARAVRQPCQA